MLLERSRTRCPSTPVSITAGAAAFKKYCAFCHNADAKGNGPLAPKDSNPPDLTDAEWVHGSSDGEVFTVIVNGAGPNSKMVGFKGKMPAQDVWHIVNYLRSLGPKTPDAESESPPARPYAFHRVCVGVRRCAGDQHCVSVRAVERAHISDDKRAATASRPARRRVYNGTSHIWGRGQ